MSGEVQIDRLPITSLLDLDQLDDAEMIEGYNDGCDGFPCGDNRSRSYWHGWKNGMVDSGRMPVDWAQSQLVKAYIRRGKLG